MIPGQLKNTIKFNSDRLKIKQYSLEKILGFIKNENTRLCFRTNALVVL